jgi:signal transduction histidine kinase
VLAGDIAHELANLMVVIRGHTALLNNERHPGERAASLAAIDEASASAAKLTRQLRALTRMQQIDDRAGAAAA